LEGLNGFVFIYQRVAALIVPDLVGRCFRLYPVVLCEFKRKRLSYQRIEPQVAPNRMSNLEEKYTRWVYDPKTFNRGDVLLEDKSCIGASVGESFAISRRRLVKIGL